MQKPAYLTVITIILVTGLWIAVGQNSDRIAKNRVVARSLPECDDPAFCTRIRDARIIDAHADTLLHRDPAKGTGKGHVSLDRLLSAGIDIQIFALATFAPKMQAAGADVCGSEDATNRIALLFAAKEPFRPGTWVSHEPRIRRMRDRFSDPGRSQDGKGARFLALRDAGDMTELIRLQDQGEPVVGAFLSIEGFYWASGDRSGIEAELDRLAKLGIRMVGLTQRASNHLAGSNEDCGNRGGLTDLGRFAVREIWSRGMALDLAHASSDVIGDVADMAALDDAVGPVVVSHTGIRRTCNRARNLSDDDIRNVARAGGVIGIGFWSWVGCWEPDDELGSIRQQVAQGFADAHAALSTPGFREEMGAGFDPTDHLALGSDFDGATTMPIDVRGVPWLIEGIARIQQGDGPLFGAADIEKIAGGNMQRVIVATLASGTEPKAR